MFCPVCGTLAVEYLTQTSPAWVKCPNYNCRYTGIATNLVELADGRIIDTSRPEDVNSHSPCPEEIRMGPVPVIEPRTIDNVVNRVVFEDLREMHVGCEIWAMTMHDVYNYG